MAKTLTKVTDVIQLRSSATSYTSTGENGTEIVDARLRGMKGAVAMIIVHAISDSTDELYTLQIQGRSPSGTGSYTTLLTVALGFTAGTVAGTYLYDLDTLRDGMRFVSTITGTSKAITYSIFLIVPAIASQYQPSPGTVISA